MIIKNYPQLAKKTFFMGLSRPFVLVFIFIFSIFFSILSLASLNTLIIVEIFLAIFSYCFFVGKFRVHPYWWDKFILIQAIKINYPFMYKNNTIISR